MDEKISRTMNYYDGISTGYCELYHREQKNKISLIKKHISGSDLTVLDLGCGDGVFNEFIGNDCNLVSFDLSFELLKLNPNEMKVQGSATRLPFQNEVFDMIASFTAIQDIDEFEKVIDESKKVLKSDGKLILSFLKMSSKSTLIIDKLEKEFKISEKIEEEKDFIYVLEKK